LAALALFRGQVVSKDRLADAVWADWPPAQAEKVLRTHVHRLRRALGDGVIETHRDGYALAPGVVIDAKVFEAEASTADSAPALRAALARWRGEPYVDLGEWAPAELERTRLAELRDGALETCLALEIEGGGAAGCIAELSAMVADAPLRERRWFLLMTALWRDGRVADALRAYERARKVFAEELGIDPGPELRALEEDILLADIRGPRRGNLPRQLTSFVGRERELAQVAGLVRTRSLVTLTGVGGVGKTRLALEVAALLVGEFPDGVWLCELGPVTNPDGVWESLAATLGVRPPPGRTLRDVLLDYLEPKRLLLVLDNCEHLVSAVSRAADTILQRCTRVALLATSRERLAVPGERIVAVSPLSVPSAEDTVDALIQSDAVMLFSERAHDTNDAFGLTNRNAPAVAELCRQLDGLPLALELAAARVRSMSPGDLVARIDERLRLLTKGGRTAPERHRTLRNSIDWSYNLLTEAQQRALNGLSVFAGGCDLVSAEAVLGADDVVPEYVVDLLDELVDKSLVEVDATDGQRRYRLLETIRQYARERLEAAGETVRVRDGHLARYVSLAEQAGPHLRGRDVFEWVDLLRRETHNFRAALDWAVEARLADEALRLVVALTVGPTPTGWIQTDWVEAAISIPGASQQLLYPLAAATAAIGAVLGVDLERGATLVAVAQDAQTRLDAHYSHVSVAAGTLAIFQADRDQARHHARVAVDLARASQDPSELVGSLTLYSSALQPDRKEAAVVAEEAVRVARDAELASEFLYAAIMLISIIGHEQPSRTDALLDEVAEVAHKLGDRQAIAMAIGGKGGSALIREDWPTALRFATDAAELDLQLGSIQFGIHFTGASISLAHLEIFEASAVLAGFAERFPPPTYDQQWQPLFDATDRLLLDTLGPTRTAELKAHGATLSNADAVIYLRRQREGALEDDHPAHVRS
jgi:predicted ATPase/DNA-binding SARP family transcriptional activator